MAEAKAIIFSAGLLLSWVRLGEYMLQVQICSRVLDNTATGWAIGNGILTLCICEFKALASGPQVHTLHNTYDVLLSSQTHMCIFVFMCIQIFI